MSPPKHARLRPHLLLHRHVISEMARYTQIWRYALLFLTYLSAALAATPTSFCKCTCFTNSTIIPLDGPSSSLKNNTFFSDPSPPSLKVRNDNPLFDTRAPAEGAKRTCNNCNKQFCLSYNLPICKDADVEKDVFATCFQRDSTKDEIVVVGFIFATVSLLAWATIKPWVERWREGRGYARVGG
ncbi:hypothetical protein CLAFUW4_11382 [Fulvia fulva]|uniref:Uncharacterized protein n=1 Tax=Passalora fulva TaxID=5499 RepID=A0A9Q8PDD8_PASFU|nr:uncharacterized protein CLAFUR5_10424 [Fulvia fulva]KAK4619809.1 hypothetical protein CLAFUR4_11388 [Fulvia fulva]KAK4620429.1 hypothetical protein CLAFUR0_11394 [Fulvia fulva]UJO20404.1 hypothetical protein CLAFUR5_10424 [Fulvia fulva]WPV17237.1 hypothetical protein CLAFUW4_11382 [Fulvia fulva]WPV31848.1 hypothetical protein CLAFUW7_11378 [Fulvia fulva]